MTERHHIIGVLYVAIIKTDNCINMLNYPGTSHGKTLGSFIVFDMKRPIGSVLFFFGGGV